MNGLAAELGMSASTFADPAGIDPGNVSTAHDLLKLLDAVATESWVREKCLEATFDLTDDAGKVLKFGNPNRLVRSREWELVLGKTGYISEAGRNLVVRAKIAGRTVAYVGYYLVGLSLLTIVSLVLAPETSKKSLYT